MRKKNFLIKLIGSTLVIGTSMTLAVVGLTSCWQSGVKYVMHRGLSSEYFENTTASFEAAGKLRNTWGIETDIYLTENDNNKHPLVCAHDVNPFRADTGTGLTRNAGYYYIDAEDPSDSSYVPGKCNPYPDAYDPLWDPRPSVDNPGGDDVSGGGYQIVKHTYSDIQNMLLWTGHCTYSSDNNQYEVTSDNYNFYGLSGDYTVPLFSEYLNICKKYNKEAVIEIKDENIYWGTDYANALMLELINEVNESGWSDHCTIIAFDGSVYAPPPFDPLALPFYNALKTLSTSSTDDNIKETALKLLPKFQKLIWGDHTHESPTSEAYWAINQNLNIDVDSSVLLASGGANIVRQAHKKGLIVNTWTVNDEKIRDELLAIGVDQVSTNIAF
jgi:glycerophosphoryl diester phosphodiesterase